jgi:RNA polymerase sigma-70 factor (ECF subfamily)
MSSRSREVLLLVAVAGLDHADAAAVCGIRPDALRQRLSRARAELAAFSTRMRPRRCGCSAR